LKQISKNIMVSVTKNKDRGVGVMTTSILGHEVSGVFPSREGGTAYLWAESGSAILFGAQND
jgi:hypothetical protein